MSERRRFPVLFHMLKLAEILYIFQGGCFCLANECISKISETTARSLPLNITKTKNVIIHNKNHVTQFYVFRFHKWEYAIYNSYIILCAAQFNHSNVNCFGRVQGFTNLPIFIFFYKKIFAFFLSCDSKTMPFYFSFLSREYKANLQVSLGSSIFLLRKWNIYIIIKSCRRN